ncbi:MAG: hypothetical protein R2932_25425 [Caldilineaceae bacterium]
MSTEQLSLALATTYHDPRGVLYPQLANYLPWFQEIFAGIAVNVSPELHGPTCQLLAEAGVNLVEQSRTVRTDGVPELGQVRRAVVAQALQLDTPFLIYCDGDRLLHWAERYPEELVRVLAQVPA